MLPDYQIRSSTTSRYIPIHNIYNTHIHINIYDIQTLVPSHLVMINGLFHIHIPRVTAVLLCAQFTPSTGVEDVSHP